VKKIMLTIATLILFGSALASAQTLGFASTGGALYCNYEQLSYYGARLWAGADNLSACGFSENATISGFSVVIPKRKGILVQGPGVIYGDSLYVTLYGVIPYQWTVYTKTKCNPQNKFGQYLGGTFWVGVAGFSGFLAGANGGPLMCTVPGKKGVVATLGPSIGAAHRAFIRSGGN
jgi:hypothetical protein